MPSNPFPKGNTMWQLRATVGRDMLFSSPELLLDAFSEYVSAVAERPILKWEIVKQALIGGELMSVPSENILLIKEFCIFCGASPSWFSHFRKGPNCTADFEQAFNIIETYIENQHFRGAATGFFKEGFIMRLHKMADVKDVVTNGESLNKHEQLDLSKLTEDELRTLAHLQSKSRISPAEDA